MSRNAHLGDRQRGVVAVLALALNTNCPPLTSNWTLAAAPDTDSWPEVVGVLYTVQYNIAQYSTVSTVQYLDSWPEVVGVRTEGELLL